MGKKKTQIQIKKESQEAKLALLQVALTKAKEKERANRTEYGKRKSVETLEQFIAVPLKGNNTARAKSDYACRSYNLSRQVLGLIDHVFAYYRVPEFLYRSVLTRKGIDLIFPAQYVEPTVYLEAGSKRFVRWFLLAAQGGSLAKEMNDLLTKKEVHWFLKAPAQNSIESNLFWARCLAAGVTEKVAQYLTERIGLPNLQKALGDRTEDLLRFYANSASQMGTNELREVTDFVRAMIQDNGFSFKGRTFGSMLKLSNEWHANIYAERIVEYRSWSPMFEHWLHKRKDSHIHAVELTNNRALMEEGRRQQHCVFGYTNLCVNGSCRIVSLRWIAPGASLADQPQILSRLTLEIYARERRIVQIKGRCNRSPEDHEMKVVRLWAGDHGLQIEEWA